MASIDNKDNIRALSIAGPFARLIAEGSKEIELRSWRTQYRGLVLLHSSSSTDYDAYFDLLDMNAAECPKASIVGAAILDNCIAYTDATLWNRDLERHCWMSEEPYSDIRANYYNCKPPIGHVFVHSILFEEPILNVPGAFNYWTPRNDRQQAAFDQAVSYIKSLLVVSEY